MVPFFSLITAAYNRADVIARAIRSCLAQDFESFELIVVDDASTDATPAVVRGFTDPRVRLICRDTNGGPCQARNVAVDHARGEWVIVLDSDFSLQPGALSRLHVRCQAAAADTGNCISSCDWDNGWITPRPPPPPRMNYEGYLRWLEGVEISEYFNCMRRDVFRTLRYANSRAWEAGFHLGLARRWSLEFQPDRLVLVHTDATNRLTTGKGALAGERMLRDAPDKLADGLTVLAEHEPALRRFAPRVLAGLQRELLKQALLAGRRGVALGIAWRHKGAMTWDGKLCVILVAGLVHRSALAWLNTRF